MTTTTSSTSSGSVSIMAMLGMLVGALVCGYGLLIVPQSVLGGVWIVAIGLSVLLAGLVSTVWVGDRLDLSAADQRSLSVAFAGLAVVLAIAFVVINGASFESGTLEGNG